MPPVWQVRPGNLRTITNPIVPVAPYFTTTPSVVDRPILIPETYAGKPLRGDDRPGGPEDDLKP
jgi:hypothetical protein